MEEGKEERTEKLECPFAVCIITRMDANPLFADLRMPKFCFEMYRCNKQAFQDKTTDKERKKHHGKNGIFAEVQKDY